MWDANDEWRLRIASIDKKFSISLPVIWLPFDATPSDKSIPVYVSGPEFPGLDGRKDVWLRCRSIEREEVETTPGFVGRILEWALDPDKSIEILEASE